MQGSTAAARSSSQSNSAGAVLLVCLILVTGAVPNVSSGQDLAKARIIGTVVDNDTGVALPDVHVFVSKSVIGAVTDSDGRYILTLPLGAHRIVVSMIGYISQTHDFVLRATGQFQLDLQLTEEIVPVGEVTVSAERDKDWDGYLDRFKKQFIGEGGLARQVEIINPEIIDFRENDGIFIAETAEPLFLVNRALGYRIEHHLHQFVQEGDETWQDGESYFEPMEADTVGDSLRWENNREEAFYGSAQHFLLSLIKNQSKDEGFITYAVDDPRPVGESDPYVMNQAAPFRQPHFAVNPYIYVEKSETDNEYVFDFSRYLEIVYTREPEDDDYARWQKIYHSGERRPFQHSWINLRSGPVTVDAGGNVVEPYGVAYFGYMAFERLASLLPKEYRPASF